MLEARELSHDFEVLDGDLAGQIVQARIDPIGDPDATKAAAALILEST